MPVAPDNLDNDEQVAFYAGARAFWWDNEAKHNTYSSQDRAAFEMGRSAAATESNPHRAGEHIKVQGLVKAAEIGSLGGVHYQVADQRGATYGIYADTPMHQWSVGVPVEFSAIITFSRNMTFDLRDVREQDLSDDHPVWHGFVLPVAA